MSKVCQRYAKGRRGYFTKAALQAARRRISNSGLSHRDIATNLGVSLDTVRKVLYGRGCALRGGSHRVAVALGLKKINFGGLKFPAAENLNPQPEIKDDIFAECDEAKLKILRLYPNEQVKEEPAAIPPGFDFRTLAKRHGWQPSYVHTVAKRKAGALKCPGHHTKTWLVCAAICLELGGEICQGMAKDIAKYRGYLSEHLATLTERKL